MKRPRRQNHPCRELALSRKGRDILERTIEALKAEKQRLDRRIVEFQRRAASC